MTKRLTDEQRKVSIRTQAKLAGVLTYTPEYECRACGDRQRYTSTGNCVTCHLNRYKSKNVRYTKEEQDAFALERAIAVHEGQTTYDGKPCKHCKATLRYVSNTGCVHCSANRVSKWRAEKAAAYHSDTSLIKIVPGAPSEDLQSLYALCPGYQIPGMPQTARVCYTDASNLAPAGMRLFTGHDVFQRPELMQWILNKALALHNARVPYDTWPEHCRIAWTLRNGYSAAIRHYNEKLRNQYK